MNKNLVLFLSAVLMLGAVSTVNAAENSSKPYAVINESTIPKTEPVEPPVSITAFEYDPKLYPNPNLNHAIASYKDANYTGAAQELISFVDKNPENAKAYYYLAVTLANLGDTDAAISAYEKVITLNPNEAMVTYAAKGRDCLTGGPLCAESGLMEGEEPDPLDEFINAPYGDGFSPELKEQMKYKDLENILEESGNIFSVDLSEAGNIVFGDCNFSGNNSIKELILPDSLTEIDTGLFYGYRELEKVVLPENLKVIGESAFAHSTIKEITLPESLEKIGALAFYECHNLQEVAIPGKVTSIGNVAFTGFGLKKITFYGNANKCSIGTSVFPLDIPIYVYNPENIPSGSPWKNYSLQRL